MNRNSHRVTIMICVLVCMFIYSQVLAAKAASQPAVGMESSAQGDLSMEEWVCEILSSSGDDAHGGFFRDDQYRWHIYLLEGSSIPLPDGYEDAVIVHTAAKSLADLKGSQKAASALFDEGIIMSKIDIENNCVILYTNRDDAALPDRDVYRLERTDEALSRHIMLDQDGAPVRDMDREAAIIKAMDMVSALDYRLYGGMYAADYGTTFHINLLPGTPEVTKEAFLSLSNDGAIVLHEVAHSLDALEGLQLAMSHFMEEVGQSCSLGIDVAGNFVELVSESPIDDLHEHFPDPSMYRHRVEPQKAWFGDDEG